MNVLVVDDHPTNRKLLRVILESEGHSVIEARNGAEALKTLEREPIDVVISDLLMPVLDGYKLCSEIRRRDDLRSIAFIVYTATYTSIADESLAYDLGADAFLRKPANAATIIHTIEEAKHSERSVPKIELDNTDVIGHYAQRLSEKLDEKNTQLSERTQQLNAAHSQLRHLLTHSPAVLYTFAIRGSTITPTVVGNNLGRLVGETPEEITFEWWVSRIHPSERLQVKDALANVIRAEGYSLTYRFLHAEGSYRWIEDNCRLVRNDAGEPVEGIGTWTDMSDRVFAANALRESQSHFRTILETAEFLAVIVDEQGLITFCNEYFLRMMGYKCEEILGEEWFEKFLVDQSPQHQEWFYRRFRTTTPPDSAYDELSIKTKLGEVRDVVLTMTPIRDAMGNLVSMAIIGGDVTERNQATQALQDMNQELERRVQERTAALEKLNVELKVAKELAEMANHTKTAFLSRMSHEFRTPMNSILGFGQLLAMSDLDPLNKDSVSHILKSGKHLLGLINDILEISKLEEGSFGVSIEPVSLQEVFQESISLLRPMAEEQKVVVEVEETSQRVQADTQRLRQVMLNLISNAIKYNQPSGHVRIGVSDMPDEMVAIDVQDTGIGISRAQQRKLFTPFDRLGAEQTNIDGTGLGLALSKSLVEAMGGKVLFESKEGHGTTFRLILPRGEENLEPASPVKLTRLPIDFEREGVHTILVIDDNLVSAQLLERLFSFRDDIHLLTAYEGGLGIAMAATHLPDLILLDYHLPDMTGLDALTELKKNPDLSAIPVIIISADAYSAQKESLLKAGAFRYMTKPFELESLIEAVHEGIQESQNRG